MAKDNANVGRRRGLNGEDLGEYRMRQDNMPKTNYVIPEKKEGEKTPRGNDMDEFRNRRNATRLWIEQNYDLNTGKHKTDPNEKPLTITGERYSNGGKLKKLVHWKDGETYDFGEYDIQPKKD